MIRLVASTAAAVAWVSCAHAASSASDDFAAKRLQQVATMAQLDEEFLKTMPEKRFVASALTSVRDSIKDPASAQFRGTRVVRTPSGRVVCGEVNAKNSFGGYVGFQPFVAGATSAQLWENDTQYKEVTDAANAGIRETCAR